MPYWFRRSAARHSRGVPGCAGSATRRGNLTPAEGGIWNGRSTSVHQTRETSHFTKPISRRMNAMRSSMDRPGHRTWESSPSFNGKFTTIPVSIVGLTRTRCRFVTVKSTISRDHLITLGLFLFHATRPMLANASRSGPRSTRHVRLYQLNLCFLQAHQPGSSPSSLCFYSHNSD